MDFRRTLGDRPQRPAKSFAEMREFFLEPLPEEGMDGPSVIEELAARANVVQSDQPEIEVVAIPVLDGRVGDDGQPGPVR